MRRTIETYEPGMGAETLRWVPGMSDARGWRCLLTDPHEGAFVAEPPPTGRTSYTLRSGWASTPPDLADRTTLLAALDQRCAELGWSWEIHPRGEGFCVHQDARSITSWRMWALDDWTPAQGLDFLLWVTEPAYLRAEGRSA